MGRLSRCTFPSNLSNLHLERNEDRIRFCVQHDVTRFDEACRHHDVGNSSIGQVHVLLVDCILHRPISVSQCHKLDQKVTSTAENGTFQIPVWIWNGFTFSSESLLGIS